MGTLALIVLIQRFFRGFLATVAVLIGLVAGTVTAWALGDATFGAVADSAWVGVTTPFYFGWPKFSIAAIVSMVVVMLITAVETTGDVFATAEIVDKRVGRKDIAAALRADGLATTIGGVFNSFPYTCFAENVGLVRLTQVKSRWVVAAAGGFMILVGLVPKAGAVVAGIPHPVLGGAALAMFATVAVVGIQTLGKVDFNDHRNVVIVGTSLGLAMLVTAQPGIAEAVPSWAQIILGSGITLGSITAILLNAVFFHIGRGHGAAVAGAPGHRQIRLEDVNAMSREQFVDTFGTLFQGPTWVVENAYTQRPFSSTSALRLAFQEALFAATPEQQRELMDAYPALGSDTVAEGAAGEQSTLDQATAGLTRLTEEDHAAFREVTTAYREKFGFPLIICVRDNPSRERILDQGRARLENSPTQEHAAALIEIAKIAGHRFDDLVADANPIHSARTQRYGATTL
jgi:OHCU decarboxylase